MKKTIAVITLVFLPLTTYGFSRIPSRTFYFDDLSVPSKFQTTGQTAMLEWGCPVSETIAANSPAEAIHRVAEGCRAEVSKAALGKPDVLEIIETNVIWPDVNISEEGGRYKLHGTLFFETLVLRNGRGF